jgi:cysteinyl-tRNA synthetase
VLDGPQGSELRALKAQTDSAEPAAARAVTVLTVVHGWQPDVERWLLSLFTHCKADFEALVVDNSGDTRLAGWLDQRSAERLRVLRLDPPEGFGIAVNAAIDAAAGAVCVLCDQSIEFTGDAVTPLVEALEAADVAVAGSFGLRARDSTIKEFEEDRGPDVDAVEGYCMAFRRADALAAGGMDPKFRFYRIADLDFSFRLREHGGRALALPDLPLIRHEHRLWEATDAAERDRLSKRNFYRFLDRWRTRRDLLTRQ